MKHVLVTGANGQLGNSLKQAAREHDHFRFHYIDVNDLDLTDEWRVRQYFKENRFSYIINCAAYTQVDQAEKQPDKAFPINADVPLLLGSICLEESSFLIHLSTDYVYNGNICRPHTEDEHPAALSVYAKSKLQGDMHIIRNPQAMIIRTSWLYGEYGQNFLKTMIRLSGEKQELSVVFDQTGTPTYSGDLASAILQILIYSEDHGFKPGIYNFSNEGVCSWYDFATEIMHLLRSGCAVRPVRTRDYPLPATRPEYGVMDKSKIKNTFGIAIRHWREALIAALKNMENSKEI